MKSEIENTGSREQGAGCRGRYFYAPLTLILVMVLCGAGFASTVKPKVFTVEFKGEVTLTGKTLFLKDAAKVTPDYAGALPLGALPLPGGRRVIAKEAVMSLLKKNYGSGVKIVFKGGRKSVVTVEAFPLLRQDAEAFLRKSVAERLQKELSDVQIEIVSFPPGLLLPTQDYALVLPSKKIKLASFLSVPLEIHIDGTMYRRILVGMKMKVYGKVYALKKTLMKGDLFTEDAAAEGIDDIAKLPYDVLEDMESVKGMAAKENLGEGSILRKSAFELPKIVRKGDVLEIFASVGGVSVSAKGKALQDGKKGDVIRVENVDSHKFVYAKVVSQGQVEVPAKEE